MESSWIIRRLKSGKMVLQKLVEPEEKYTYTQIPLTEEEARKTLLFSKCWEKLAHQNTELLEGYYLVRDYDPEKFDKLEKRIIEKAHANKPAKASKNLSYESDVPGTSRIILSRDHSRIHIAHRKNRKSGKINNKTYISSVCIDDETRIRFFNQSKEFNGTPSNSIYCIYHGDPTFNWWREYMVKEYQRLKEISETNRESA